MKINTKVVRISAGVCLSNHTVKKKIIKYAFVGINSRTTLHLAFLMFLLYIISVRKIWTQSPVLIGFFVLLPTGEERSSLWLLRDRTGHSNQRVFSIKRKLHSSFSPSKSIISSVLLTLSLPFHVLLPSSSVREQKGTLGRKFPQPFHKDIVIYHRGSSSKHYPYIQKQASKKTIA